MVSHFHPHSLSHIKIAEGAVFCYALTMSTDYKSISWYEENAEGYTKHVRDPKDSIYHSLYEKPAMYQAIPDIKDKQVISLGCGSGEDSN